jgi:hypothetical protein
MRFAVVRSEQTAALRDTGVAWARFGDVSAVWAEGPDWTGTTREDLAGALVREHPDDVRPGDLHVVTQLGRLFQHDHPDVAVLLDKGRYLAVSIPPDRVAELDHEHAHFRVRPLASGTVLFDTVRPTARTPAAWVQALVDEVSRPRYESHLVHLVSYPTRHSLSPHHETAVNWARDVLTHMGYTTRVDGITVGAGTSRNLIADKAGTGSGTRDLVLVVAHLDSVNQSGGASAPAPGADDNGSGAAGLLEIARVFASHEGLGDLRLVLFGGEEQGLHGSIQYVAAMPAADRARLAAVINMDMIATRNTPQATVLLEGAMVSQRLVDDLATAAASYTGLAVQTSFDPFNSDHVPFIDAGLAAVLTIEGADGANGNIHTAGDTLAHIDYDLALEIVRMNVAAVAGALGRKGTVVSPLPHFDVTIDRPVLDRPWILDMFGPWLRNSGVYEHNGGAAARGGGDDSAERSDAARDPSIILDRPIFIDRPPIITEWFLRPRFTLHVDIDGTDPLGVVSGTVSRGLFSLGSTTPHFVGRVTSNTVVGGARKLIVQDFAFTWPGGSRTIDCVEITLTGWLYNVSAEVTFVASATGTRYGPYTTPRRSPWFREVEFEVDVESDAITDIEPYDTNTHPERPAGLAREHLTLESVFAKSGIKVTRSPGSGTVVDTSEAGADSRWSNQELHDAMERHWSRFANVPQWKMWIFLARLGGSDSLGGIMFDANINEPGGVDRQGTVVFTRAPFFHSPDGAYPQANPPAAEAATRELFFNLIHETGHAFNLAHSFQKTMGTPWQAPSWMPVASDDEALSWMNYPDRPTPGANATWFYDRFRFRFSDDDNLFMRHAPQSFVQMGDADWFVNHGRVARSSLDRRLELLLRTRSEVVPFGETVFVELRLRNVSDEPVMALTELDPALGSVELAVTSPDGQRRPFVPPVQARQAVRSEVLSPDERRYADVAMTVGMFGFPFKQPGHYRVEASYHNLDGGTAAAVLHLYVSPPGSYEEERTVRSLFDAQTGLTLTVGGTRLLDDVNEKLDWAVERLGEDHPASYYLEATRALPLASTFKAVEPGEERVRVLGAEPDVVVWKLRPFVDHPGDASDAVGHIAYREIVDTLTDCAEEAGERGAAREAQQAMLGLFQGRGVVEAVVDAVRRRSEELR